MPKLLVEKGPNKDLEITVGKTVFAGRDTSAHIMLTEPMVSRLHFKIERRKDGYFLVDLDSLNGTFVNRARVRERLLKPGDMIQVGDTIFSFVSDDPATQAKSLVGKIVGGYSIIERIGRGGMGTVYKALQISLNRTVALKILSEDMLKDKTFIDMFLREARSAGQLNHNNIVQVYDVGRTPDDIYYFSMEFMPGGSIQELLIKKQRLPAFQATRMMLDAAMGLSYAEKKGIVHRDIKPDNLMISEEEIVKIGDLGLAKSVSASQQEQQSNTLMGTPHYLAPEQALGKSVDHRCDIYSLGASFYRIVSGVTPYSASSVKDIITKKLKEDPRPLKEVLPSVPDSVVGVISRMMRRNVEERYQNAGELVKELQQLKDELDPSKPLTSPGGAGGGKPTAAAFGEPRPAGREGGFLEPAGPVLPEAEKALRKSPFVRFGIPAILLVMTIGVVFLLFSYYYSDINKTLPDNGNTTNGPIHPPPVTGSEYEEKLAREYLSRARAFEAGLSSDSAREAVHDGIKLFERVINECAGAKDAVKDALEGINRLNKLLKTLDERDKQRQAEKDTLALLGQLEDRINANLKALLDAADSAVRGTQMAENFLNTSLAELDDFLRTNPRFASVTERAEGKKTSLTKWFKSCQAAGEKYRTLTEQAEIAVKNERFAQALKSVNDFINNPAYQNTIYYNIARNYHALVESRADKSFSDLMLRVEDLKDKGQLTEAQKLLAGTQGLYGIEKIEARIKEYLDWFKGQGDKIYEQLLRKEAADFPQYLMSLSWFLQSGRFDDWAAKEGQMKTAFQTREYKEKAGQYLSLIKMEKGIIDRFIDRFNTRRIDRPVLQGREIASIDTGNGLIYFVSKETPPLRFQEISIRDWELCLTGGWDFDARDCFDFAMLCICRGGNIPKAEEFFSKSLTKKPNRELQELLKTYRPKEKLEELKKNREDEAGMFSQIADKLYNEKQPGALDAFQLLRYRYVNTLVYTNNKTSIDTKIKLLGGK
ncbi:MAG: FHA domain-containing serine/threonine-protein kinase [Planctomycetota bacterium]